MRYILSSALLITALGLPVASNAGTYCHSAHSCAPKALVSTPSVTATREGNVAVYRPVASINSQRIAAQARLQDQQRAQAAVLAAQRREAARRDRETRARLAAIEAKQDAILMAQSQQNRAPQRRIYYGNPRFFGSNGFYGNRNFSGISSPAKGYGFRRSRKAVRH